MTCIVGVAKNGKVYIGADSLGSNGFTKEIRKECKVFKNGDFLIGGTTSFRMLDLLKWKFNPPTVKDDNLHKFMVTEFVDSVRRLFVDNGYCITTGDWTSGCFLVGVNGKLFSIEGDFQVYEQEYYSLVTLYKADDSYRLGYRGCFIPPFEHLVSRLHIA